MINDVNKLVSDFKAVLASLDVKQVEVLAKLSAAINERLEELKEEIANGEGEVSSAESQENAS